MKDKRTLLKVKIKSLAEEARIIRKEERDPRNVRLYIELHSHRTWEVRNEARAAQLAYGFLRGRSYETMESNSPLRSPDAREWLIMRRVTKLVEKYGMTRHYCYKEGLNYTQAKEDEAERLKVWFS